MNKRTLLLVIGLLSGRGLMPAADIWFNSAPATVPSGENYYVEAQASSWYNYDCDLTLYRNSGYFAYGWDPYSPVAGSWTSDTGVQTVEYFAASYDWDWDYYSYSYNVGYAWVEIVPGNQAPWGVRDYNYASVPQNGGLYASGWAVDHEMGAPVTRVDILIDGNDVGDANLNGYRPDVANAYGRSDFTWSGWSFNYNVGSLGVGTHSLELLVWDSGGASGVFGYTTFEVTNAAPAITLLSPSTQSINTGTALTITSHATDADGNIVTHNLEIQRPDGTWNWYGGFAYGEPYTGGPVGSAADSTRSASFTFDTAGTWYVRSWVSDANGNGVHSATVAIYVNTPPTGDWQTLPGTLYPGVNFTTRAWGHDNDGNLSQVFVEVNVNGGGWTAFAYNGGGNGYDNTSDGNVLTAGSAGTTYQFRYYVADSQGAATGWQYSGVYTVSPQPTTFALSATSFTYTGGALGPSVMPTPAGATYSTGGTLSATAAGNYTATATAYGNYTGSNASLNWSIAPSGQTITFYHPGTQTYGTPLTLGATASSGLAVSYSVLAGPATVSGNTVTFTGAGSVTVRASQGGNANYYPASSVDQAFTVNPLSTSFSLNATDFFYNGSAQGPSVVPNPAGATFSAGGTLSAINAGSYTGTATATGNYTGSNASLGWTIHPVNQGTLTLYAVTSQEYGTSQALSTSGGSGGGGVGYVITGWSAANNASLSGATLTANASSGWVDVRADKAGDGNYNATSSSSVRIYLTTRATTFGFGSLSHTYDGNPKTATVSPSPAGATYAADLTKGPNAGSYTVSVTANGNYSGSGSGTLIINPAGQTITFYHPGTQTYGTPLTLGATASSGLAVSYSVLAGPATVSGNTVTFTGAGSVTVRASQGGNANYNAAPDVDCSFTVNPQPVSYSLSQNSFTYNGSAQGPSVVPNPAGATFSAGGTLSATNVGSYTATATAYGNYTGSNASLNWSIAPSGQTITFYHPGTQTYGTPLTLGATASSGLPVSYDVTSGPASVSGNTVTFIGTGSVTITASQAGNANFGAAAPVSQTFTVDPQPTAFSLSAVSFTYNGAAQGPSIVPSVAGATFTAGGTLSATNAGSYTATATATGNYTGSNASLGWTIAKASQSISFPSPGAQTYGTSLVLGAGASSGLPVSYGIVAGPASVSGGTVTFTGTGTVTVRASQVGDGNWNAAPDVDRTFMVNPQPATFSFGNLSQAYDGTAKTATVTPDPAGATCTSDLTKGPDAGSYTVTATATGNYTGSGSATLVIAKATPSGSFGSRSFNASGVSYAVSAADLNAVFSGPAGAPAPAGSVSYAIAPGSATGTPGTPVNAGTALGGGLVYTLRATYAGDANYNGATADAVWTVILDPSADNDGDGLTNLQEYLLGTNPLGARQNDTGNANQLKINRPTP